MTTSGISSSTGAAQSGTSSAVSKATASSATLDQNQFLTLLTAQLKNQDPLNPVQNSDFTAQLAQFSTLSGVEQLNTSTQQLLQLQQLSQGAALVGKSVTYADSSDHVRKGTVDAVNLQNGKLLLQIAGNSVPSDQVRSILSSNAL